MTEELKPCPHCGTEPTEHAIEPHTHIAQFGEFRMPDHPGSHVIECGCGAGMIDDTRTAVVARWNRRAAPQPAQVAPVVRALTDEQIKALSVDCYDGGHTDPLVLFARAVLKAAGITAGDTDGAA